MKKRKHKERLEQYEKGTKDEIKPLWKIIIEKSVHEHVRISYFVNYKTHSTQ